MKLPKNFRQIGEVAGLTKIYIEDYVMTYISAITKDSRTYVRGAILFGTIERTGSETYIFVNGAMEAQNIELDLDETVFDNTVWNRIYEMKENYFKQQQVVGWYLCRTGMSVRLNDKIKRTHFENFPGDGKILYIKDPLDEEEAMYAYRGQDLIRQTGYYIYYVKNEEMQNYLVDLRKEQESADFYEKMLEQRRDERIVRQSRSKLGRKDRQTSNFIKKTAVAAAFMFLLGAAGTYAILGQAVVPRKVVTAFSDRVRNMNFNTKENGESVTAVFTAATEETEIATEEDKTETMSNADYIYTVQSGDTVTKISLKFFQSRKYVGRIMSENGLKATDSIYPGQKIKIPSVK
ncbi:MAG: LysM peptidoglycan-binding domain-containing protein [Lachnospiraceae bacterium]|nr:LysM peptidoglycan-binding domain-containing protein [Lachnospiraceae bacterium]